MLNMKEELEKTTESRMHIPIFSIILTVFFTFAVSAAAFLFGIKVFCSTPVKMAGLTSERPDPLGKALSSIAQGLNNLQMTGKTYYEQYCMVCHGEQGKGDGFNAFNLDPRPRDLTTVTKIISKESIFKTISDGTIGQDGKILCPPWERTLGENKINAIVEYLRTLGKSPSQDSESP